MLIPNKILIRSMMAAACFLCAPYSWSQKPSPTPSSGGGDGIHVTSSVELGYRGLEVNGDHEKYRSDLNYRAGFRLFDSSFLIEDNSMSRFKAFDSALIQASGFGSDPTGSFRMNVDKTGIYKLDSNIRRVRYFNNLKNHAVIFTQPIALGSQHSANTVHNFGDVDLTIFPKRDFRLRFGYGFNDTSGPGFNTIRFRSEGFQMDSTVKVHSDDFRAGVEGKLLGFNLGILYGHRRFTDRTKFTNSGANQGNDPAGTTPSLNNAVRQFNVVGTTDFGNFFFQRTFADVVDISGRFIYSESSSRPTESDVLTGRVSATGDIIINDEILVAGEANRPQARGDLGVTYRATRKFRISNTFTFDQFNRGGSNSFYELVRSTSSAGAPRADALTRTAFWRYTNYRRLGNLIEADYQFSPRFGLKIGYRYTHREVELSERDRNLISGATTRSIDEETSNTTHSFIAGAKIKPTNNWSIYLDLERGEAGNVFMRLSNYDTFSFRIRNRATIKRFSLNLSAITKDNDSPGTSVPITNAQGVLLFPATETVANTRQRMVSASIDWAVTPEIDISGGYTYNHLNSNVDAIVPVGTPIFTSTQFLLGKSEYIIRDSFFFFDISAKLHKRASVYAAYRISDDRGQGDRVQARPQDVLTSAPLRFQTPEIKLAIRLTRNVDWNLGYQYYDYKERSIPNVFATPLVVYPAQNYNAHMPYTSLRIFFGGGGDR